MISNLKRLTNCQVQSRFIETRKNRNIDIHEYSLLLFGPATGIKIAKEYLIADMSSFPLSDWYTLLVDRLTQQIQRLCGINEQGLGKVRAMPLITLNNNNLGESHYGIRAGW